MFFKLARKNKEVDAASWDELYKSEIVKRIRAKYSIDDELSIHRKRDKNPDEFAQYDAFVEKCKAEVKLMMS